MHKKQIDRSKIDVSHKGPTVDEYLALREDGGMTQFSLEAASIGLPNALFAVTLRDQGQAVGMGRVIRDGGCLFNVVDIVVASSHRGQGLGHVIMAEIMTFLKTSVPKGALVCLIADVPANKLYAQYGFEETAPASVGMDYIVKA